MNAGAETPRQFYYIYITILQGGQLMKEISEEAKARFFEEAGICLKRGGFQVGPVEEGFMPVTWQDAPLCRVNGVGGIEPRVGHHQRHRRVHAASGKGPAAQCHRAGRELQMP